MFNTQTHVTRTYTHLLPTHSDAADDVDTLMQQMADHIQLEGGVLTQDIHAAPAATHTATATSTSTAASHPPLDQMFSKKAMRKGKHSILYRSYVRVRPCVCSMRKIHAMPMSVRVGCHVA